MQKTVITEMKSVVLRMASESEKGGQQSEVGFGVNIDPDPRSTDLEEFRKHRSRKKHRSQKNPQISKKPTDLEKTYRSRKNRQTSKKTQISKKTSHISKKFEITDLEKDTDLEKNTYLKKFRNHKFSKTTQIPKKFTFQ